MIRVKAIYQGNHIQELKVSGHADFSSAGSDIVCAGVSSLVLSNLIYAQQIKLPGFQVEQDPKDGVIHVEVTTYNERVNDLLEAIMTGLHLLENDYQNYIKIKILEV